MKVCSKFEMAISDISEDIVKYINYENFGIFPLLEFNYT